MTGTVITKRGMQLLIKVLASESMLKFTRVEVGTGGLPAGYDPASMTKLNRYKMDGVISRCKADGDVAKITMQLSSAGVESGFIMSEIGIYAEDPDLGDILYAYLDLGDDPQYIYAEGGQAQKFLMFTLEVAIEEAAKVSAYINPAGLITRAEFEGELRAVKEELARENQKTREEFEELKNSAGSAEEYDPDSETPYHAGDFYMYQGVLYKCIKDTMGEWDPECWERTDALGEIGKVKDWLSGIENPEFDDSGVVETIKSFPDFLKTFVSRMNLFQFLQNLRAGLQFVLHREQVIDNCETEAEDLPLSAKQGKVLMEMHTKILYIVIPASGWTGTGSNADNESASDADDANEENAIAPFENRVAVEGMREQDNVDVTFVPMEDASNDENIAAWESYVNINYTVTEDGAIVFHALETKPEADVRVAVKGIMQREEKSPEVPQEPDPETPDPESPDPESPDPENPDPETPDPENPDASENQEEVEGG